MTLTNQHLLSKRVLVVSLSSPGFLYPAIALARVLKGSGCEVCILSGGQTAIDLAAEAGITAVGTGEEENKGCFRTRTWFQDVNLAGQFRQTCSAIRKFHPDVVVSSVLCVGAQIAAYSVGLPSIALGLMCDLGEIVGIRDASGGLARQALKYRESQTLAFAQRCADVVGFREQIPSARALVDATLVRGQSALLGEESLFEGVFDVGPLMWEPMAKVGAMHKCEQLVGEFSVYVHMSRSLNGKSLDEPIEVARKLGARVTVELGRSGRRSEDFPAACDVVQERQMMDRISFVDVVISHGTTSPVLAALLNRKGLALYPSGSEQPLLAAACERAGVLLACDGRDWKNWSAEFNTRLEACADRLERLTSTQSQVLRDAIMISLT